MIEKLITTVLFFLFLLFIAVAAWQSKEIRKLNADARNIAAEVKITQEQRTALQAYNSDIKVSQVISETQETQHFLKN